MAAHGVPPSDHGVARRHRGAKLVAAVLAACVVGLALAGCGARVDTTLTIGSGTSGSRTMTATLSSSDLSKVTGGTDAVDASIRKHLPAGLDYGGLTQTADAVVVTFTLTFSSVDDYDQKVAALLKASGSTITPQISLVNQDSTFLQGVSVEENFTSVDLLGWLSAGLVTDGVVTSDNAGNVLETGQAHIVYGGTTADTYDPISYRKIIDRGFKSVSLSTVVNNDGSYDREIDYVMAADVYATEPGTFDAWLKAATPDRGTLTKKLGADQVGWVLKFHGADDHAVAVGTAKALGASASGLFAVTRTVAADNPIGVQIAVTDNADCSAICSPDGLAVSSKLIVPNSWKPAADSPVTSGDTEKPTVTMTHDASPEPLVFDSTLPVSGIHVAAQLGYDRSIDLTLIVSVDSATVKAAKGGFAKVLAPKPGVGSLSTATAGPVTRFAVDLHGGSVADLQKKLSDYLPGSRTVLTTVSGSGFFRTNQVLFLDLALDAKLAGTTSRDEVTVAASAPFGQTARAATAPDATDGATTSDLDTSAMVTLKGWTLPGLITLGALLGLVIVAAFLLVVFRVSLRRAVAGARASRRAAAARVPSSFSAAAPFVVHASGPAPAGPDERGGGSLAGVPPFAESDLH